MITRLLRRASAVLLASLVLLAPLPFASVMPGWEALLRLCVLASFILAALATSRSIRLKQLLWPSSTVAAIGLLGWAQSLNWPRWLVRILSHEHLAHFENAGSALAAGGELLSPALTLSVTDSRQAALAWATAAAALAAAGSAGLERLHRRILGGAVLGTALYEVLYGFRHWLDQVATIWSIEIEVTPGRLRGTFVNADHLALYLEMALAIDFAWAWWSFRRLRFERATEHRLFLALAPTLVGAVLLTGLAFTGSRAGLVAALLAIAGQVLFLGLQRREWRVLPAAAALLAASLGLVTLLGTSAAFSRWMETNSYDLTWSQRRFAYAQTFELWQHFPALGSGLGSFREAFPLVQSPQLSNKIWTHAHNGFLEILATQGLLGLALLVGGLAICVLRLGRVLETGHRSEDRAAGLAALGALVAVSFHEMFDFGLTMPSNTLTLAVIVGAALCARTHAVSSET